MLERLVRGIRRYWAYPVLVGLPIGGLLVVLAIGRSLHAPPASAEAAEAATAIAMNPTLRMPIFLAQIIVVLTAARLVGGLLRRLNQPQVVGEMLAGLLLGPSMLGWLAPSAYALLFPPGTVRFLGSLSQLGLLLFMFLIGLDLDPDILRGRGRAVILTSHVSIVTPLFLGAALALALYPKLSNDSVSFVPFALFVGTALSVTAFPVLARMLSERGLERTTLGTVAIACAAVDDVTAWCLLAGVGALAAPGRGPVTVALSLAGLAAYVVVMFTAVRWLAGWAARRGLRRGQLGHDGLTAVIAFALASAWLTDRIGVHALFGAFMAGIVMPRDAGIAETIRSRSEDILLVLLLPLFFVATGIRTNVALIEGSGLLLALTVLVAIAGKLGGSAVAARAAGLSWREGLALGSLLNARGLIGLVVINVGFEAGVISSTLYAILVVTAVITTLLTAPMLSLLHNPTPAAA